MKLAFVLCIFMLQLVRNFVYLIFVINHSSNVCNGEEMLLGYDANDATKITRRKVGWCDKTKQILPCSISMIHSSSDSYIRDLINSISSNEDLYGSTIFVFHMISDLFLIQIQFNIFNSKIFFRSPTSAARPHPHYLKTN